MRLREMARRDLGFGLLDQVARDRIVRIESGRLRLKPPVVVGDLGQRLRQPLQGHVLLADDAQTSGDDRSPGQALDRASLFLPWLNEILDVF